MLDSTVLFEKLQNCSHCNSNIDCSLSMFRTLPTHVVHSLIGNTTKEETNKFRSHIEDCPLKNENKKVKYF